MIMGHLADGLLTPDRLTLSCRVSSRTNEGCAGQREKLRQARDARGGAEAAVTRPLALAETGAMEPDSSELRYRLVALRMQKTEVDCEISRLQGNVQTRQADLSPQKLKTLPLEMRRLLANGLAELRQVHMGLLLEHVTVCNHSVRLKTLRPL